MRLSIGDLELVRADLAAYRRRAEEEEHGFTFGYAQALEAAVSAYHRHNQRLDLATQHLHRLAFEHEFKNQRKLADAEHQLAVYADAFSTTGNECIGRLDQFVAEMAPGLEISGRINRYDLTPDGYAVWLFIHKPRQWQKDLRMPLLQWVYSDILLAPSSEVAVGVYDFPSGAYASLVYSDQQIEAARIEAVRLLRSL